MKLDIGYFADGPWSHHAFQKLVKDPDISIKFICVRFETKDEILKQYAAQYNVDYLMHKNINSKDFIQRIAQYNCNLFVSMSFNQIFSNEVFNLPKLKTINCHAGKLPFYRGRNILNWALINDEKEFGITVHFVDDGIDTGDILLQEVFPISNGDDYSTLLKVAYIECANILYKAVKLIKNQCFDVIKQKDIDPYGHYCLRRKRGDEIINWNNTSRVIFNFIRAICYPGPMARSLVNGSEIKINKIEVVKNHLEFNAETGVVVKIENSGCYVKTQDGAVKILEYEFEGKLAIGDSLDKK